jgi:uncharacterized repeat protein (TIGR01451 family)
MTPEQQAQLVVNGLIVDPSVADYAWRGATTLTLTVNPTETFRIAGMPMGGDCAVARHADVRIEKTASTERVAPGGDFSYRLETANVSDDSAADAVVVTDEIPDVLRITDVSWVGKGDPDAFPTWRTCAVTGQDGAGYGGTLRCELFGPLQPAGAGLGPSSAPTITLQATVSPSTGERPVRNVAVVTYQTFGDPDDPGTSQDDAVIRVSVLAVTGGMPLLALLVLAGMALAGGAIALTLRRGRREETVPTT